MNELINQLIIAGIEESEAKKEISILLKEFGKENSSKIQNIVDERIKTRIPIQYLLGKAYFMDFEIKVNKNVLIPRPETEILVEETVKRLSYRDVPLYALDIGTGSGIIPIALAKLIPNIKIVAIDIEKEIIGLASENAKKNNVEKNTDFKVCDLFSQNAEELFQKNKFDLIISNPPYLRACHGKPLQPEVCLHEPEIALSGSRKNATGLIYYERIVELVKCHDVKFMAFEIDPPLVNDLKSLLVKNNLNKFEIVQDYNKLDRCLFIYL